jgi:cell division protein ZapA
MPNEANFLDITLLGKEYRVACPPEERDGLLAAVALVDAKMHDIAEKTKSNIAERIAVMAALNIAHEHLSQKKEALISNQNPDQKIESEPRAEGLDFGAVRRRILDMEAKLDAVMAPQEKLL